MRGRRGTWPDAVSVSVRPDCAQIVPPGRQPELLAADLALVCRWVVLDHDVILDFRDGAIDFPEAGARLRRLP